MNFETLQQLQRKLAAVTVERDALAAELAKLRAAPVVAASTGFIPTPFIPDADTRRNDAEFAAQQAAPAHMSNICNNKQPVSEKRLREILAVVWQIAEARDEQK